jgi:hypothetical protein
MFFDSPPKFRYLLKKKRLSPNKSINIVYDGDKFVYVGSCMELGMDYKSAWTMHHPIDMVLHNIIPRKSMIYHYLNSCLNFESCMPRGSSTAWPLEIDLLERENIHPVILLKTVLKTPYNFKNCMVVCLQKMIKGWVDPVHRLSCSCVRSIY